jgi:hypothetical protein
MQKLWFYFNSLQLADSFMDFANVKPPANLGMIQKAYKSIIHVKLVPDSVVESMKEQVGLPTNQTDTTTRMLRVEPNKVLRNRLIVAGALVALVIPILVIFVLRKRIWKSLSQYRKN